MPGWVSALQTHCRVSNINFDIWFILFWRGVSINILWKIYEGRQIASPLGVSIKGVVRAFNWLKLLVGFLHLKPTVGCQISTLIFEFSFVEGGLYEYPVWVSAPQAHSRVSNINFDIWIFFWRGDLYKYSMKNILRTAKFLPTWGVSIKGVVWAFNWLKCLGGFQHLKPLAGCQISTLIFEFCFVEGSLYNIPSKIYQGRHSSCPLVVSIKDIARVFNWFKCLVGVRTSSPQQGVKYQLWYAVKYHALGYSLLYKYQRHSRNFRIDGSFMKTSMKDSNTTKCHQIWVPNNPYIFTSNYHCLYLSIYLFFFKIQQSERNFFL